jgi:hypothetical protein
MPAQSEMIIRGAVDDSANKLTYEANMLVEANEAFFKKDKALVGRSLVQASKNVFVRVMNPSANLLHLFNISFTWLSTSFAKTSGSLRGGCFMGCADPVAMLCFTTFVLP